MSQQKNVYVLASISMDLFISTPYLPKIGETLIGNNFFTGPGGKGNNQTVAVAKQNINTFLIGSVGNDLFGNEVSKSWENLKIDTKNLEKLNNVSTGIAVIINEKGNNRIIIDCGANHKMTKERIDKALENAKEGDILINQLEVNIDMVKYSINLAKEKKMINVFNPAPAIKLEQSLLKNIDYLIVNEGECEMISDVKIDGNNINEKVSKEALNKIGVKNLIITLGENGSVFVNEKEYFKIDAVKIKSVDSTAAGDAFVGVFASQLVKGKNVKDAMSYASYAGTLTCLKNGSHKSIPSEEELNKFIEENKK